MSTDTNAETGPKLSENVNTQNLVVRQPEKFHNLLETISLIDRVSETVGATASENWSGSGGTTGAQQGDDDDAQSARAQAIANLPPMETIKKDLRKHIESEIKTIRKEIKHSARKAGKPGKAYKMNVMYAKIRRLNNLLAELLEASTDVLKRIYIRIFVDKQKVV